MPAVDANEVLAVQDGLISRTQAHASGLVDADIRRLVRRREWARVHPGVYVDHTGTLTWRQRAWAAVLHAEPAALWGVSALRAADGPGRRGHDDSAPIHVAIDARRRVRKAEGMVVHRVVGLKARVSWNLSPPRLRMEEALLDVASLARDDFAAVAVMADAVQSRRTTAARVLATLARRPRIPRRDFLTAVLEDVDAGACSALEQAYLTRVERAHGLPVASRQVRDSARGPVFRDVVYVAQHTVIELDGRIDHSSATDRDRDLDRDLEAALHRLGTVRLGWGQAVGRPCRTARALGELLRLRGWRGQVTACPECERGNSQSPDGWETPRSA